MDFATDPPTGPGVDTCFIRGLGGIGKTTLTNAVAEDFLVRHAPATVLPVDCAGMSQPTIASLLRALPASPQEERALRAAAVTLDTIGAAVRLAPPPSDSDEVTLADWPRVRGLATETLTFFTAAGLEQLAFGQIASSATNAVVAGAQTVAAGASALAHVLASAKEHGRLSSQEADLALDLDAYVSDVLATFLSAVLANVDATDHRLLLTFDKAENVTSILPRVISLIERAAVKADVRPTIVFAGRLVQIPAPDGSIVTAAEYLDALAGATLDLELAQFEREVVAEVVASRHSQFHGTPSVPPPWVTEAVLESSGGLPLWVASIAEAVVTLGPEPWTNETEAIQRLTRDVLDRDGVINRIFRDAQTAEGESTFPLLVALAIAPAECPAEALSDAAGFPRAALAELRARHSFMRKDGLHDTARAVLREALARGPGVDPTVLQVGEELRSWIDSTRPAGSPHSGSDEWNRYVQDLTSIELWLDADAGVRTAINFILTGTPWAAAWIGPLFRTCGWFIRRQRVSRSTLDALSACARAAFPLLMLESFAAPFDHDLPLLRRSVLSAVQDSPQFEPLVGRALDHIDRLARRERLALDEDASVSLDALRATWLVRHGFDDEARDLCLNLSGQLNEIEEDALIREHIGSTLLALIRASASWQATETGDARTAREEQADTLLTALVEVNPALAAQGVGILLSELGATPSRRTIIHELMARRRDIELTSEFYAALGSALLMVGDFGGAELLYRELLARAPDSLSGALGLGRALTCQLRLDEANDTLRTALDESTGRDLTEFGSDVRRAIASDLATNMVVRGDVATADELLVGEIQGSYGEFLITIMTADPDAAFVAFHEHVDGSAIDQRRFAAEAVIVLSRSGHVPNALAAAHEWQANRGNSHTDVIDALILRNASEVGMLPDAVREQLSTDIGLLTEGNRDPDR